MFLVNQKERQRRKSIKEASCKKREVPEKGGSACSTQAAIGHVIIEMQLVVIEKLKSFQLLQ
jgi:hypothetical protein